MVMNAYSRALMYVVYYGGQLDTQYAQLFQFSLCSSNRNKVCIPCLETGTTMPHRAVTTLSVMCYMYI